MVKVAMHQSQYIPWPPYFKKIAAADIFVLMDSVQFQKNGVQNRNKIRNKNGDFWLTIPVTGHLGDRILDIKIADVKCFERHWKSLSIAYSKAPYWDLYAEEVERLYAQRYSSLGVVNEKLFDFIVKKLKIKTKIIRLSKLNIQKYKSDLILSVCKDIGADMYISGPGGRNYIDEKEFLREGISIQYKNSTPPTYVQFHGKFIPNLSIIDMMFNTGVENIAKYLESAGS